MASLITFLESIPLLALILLSGVSLVAGDLAAKYWSENHKTIYFLLALASYILYGLFFIPSLTKEKLVIAALAVIIVNIIGFVFIGLVIFHEKLTTLQIAGLIFGLISIILLESEI